MQMKTLSPMIFLCLCMVCNVQADTEGSCKNPIIRIIGPEETVFHYETDRCSKDDVPDSPAMAFINKAGQVVLFNGIAGSYPSIGTSLNTVKRDCTQSLFANNPDPKAGPEAYYNNTWLRNPWTYDGQIIYALVHNEYNTGPTGWYPNIIAAKSTNAGKSFEIIRDAQDKPQVAMITPYRYSDEGQSQGIAQQTNTLSKIENGRRYFYVLVFNNVGHGHPKGNCLVRNDDISDPSRWRAWDGKGFNTMMNVSLYKDSKLNPEQHVCQTIIPKIGCTSWTFNTTLKQYIAVCNLPSNEKRNEAAFAYILSHDMLHWSEPVVLKNVHSLKEYRESSKGSGVNAEAYPSLLDPASRDRNFEYSGSHPYLYYTAMPAKAFGVPWQNRDLKRVALSISCADQ